MISGNFSGALEAPIPAVLGTTNSDVVTCATGDAGLHVAGFTLANDSGSAVVCRVYYYRASDTTDYLFMVKSVGANDTFEADTPIRLRPGDKIKAKAATGSVVTMTPANIRAVQNANAANFAGSNTGR